MEQALEIANVNGENVLMFIDGNPSIIPLLENSKTDYLPDIFTIEFDFFKPENGNRIFVYLYDDKVVISFNCREGASKIALPNGGVSACVMIGEPNWINPNSHGGSDLCIRKITYTLKNKTPC